MSRFGNQRRTGVTLLEIQVAFVLFGIALAGLAPLSVMHLKQLQRLENRLSDKNTYYLSPSSDPWARKLGAAAQIAIVAGPGPAPGGSSGANEVRVLSVEKSFSGQDVTVHISLLPIVP
jgi:hypothetical protein